MQRDANRLRAAAGKVEEDLRRTTGRPWRCTFTDDFTLHLSDDVHTTHSVVPVEIEDEDWFTPPDADPAELDEGLSEDADEVVATTVAEALQVLGIAWPLCPQHQQVLDACSGWWCCGAPTHDVAAVGSLPAH